MTLNKQITSGLGNLLENTSEKGAIFNVELGHSPIGINKHGNIEYGLINNGVRCIEEGLLESILLGLEVSRIIKDDYKKQVKLILSLSDVYDVSIEQREAIKGIIYLYENIIPVFEEYGLDNTLINQYNDLLEKGTIVFQSDATSQIRNKISQIKRKLKKQGCEDFYTRNSYLVFDVSIGDYSGTILFSSECFQGNSILKQGIPLLFGENGITQSTQCGPTVTGIQQKILGNNKNNRILTIDNAQDISILQKSLRGQLLLKLFYGKESSFLSPMEYNNNNFIPPIMSIKKMDLQELINSSIESLKKSGYDKVSIYGEENFLLNVKSTGSIKCLSGICNT